MANIFLAHKPAWTALGVATSFSVFGTVYAYAVLPAEAHSLLMRLLTLQSGAFIISFVAVFLLNKIQTQKIRLSLAFALWVVLAVLFQVPFLNGGIYALGAFVRVTFVTLLSTSILSAIVWVVAFRKDRQSFVTLLAFLMLCGGIFNAGSALFNGYMKAQVGQMMSNINLPTTEAQ